MAMLIKDCTLVLHGWLKPRQFDTLFIFLSFNWGDKDRDIMYCNFATFGPDESPVIKDGLVVKSVLTSHSPPTSRHGNVTVRCYPKFETLCEKIKLSPHSMVRSSQKSRVQF